VNIVTKSFPNAFVFSYSLGMAYNTQSTFRDHFMTYPGGSTDWAGFDDGTRAIPPGWVEGDQGFFNNTRPGGDRTPASRRAAADETIHLTRQFSPHMTPTREAPPFDHNFSLTVGLRWGLGRRKRTVLKNPSANEHEWTRMKFALTTANWRSPGRDAGR
jgi:hypothetical protein